MPILNMIYGATGGGGGWKPGANTIAYYPLETDTNDYSGNNRDGVNTGVTFSDGFGIFDGSASISLGTADRTKIQAYQNATISAWFNWNGNSNGILNMVIGKMMVNPNNKTDALFATNIYSWSSDMSHYGQLVCGVYTGSDRAPVPFGVGGSGPILTSNTWYNVILSKEGTTKNVYVNGILAGTGTGADTTSSYNPELKIGEGTYNNYNSYFQGKISNVIIEDKARTAQEIADYYDFTKGNYGL